MTLSLAPCHTDSLRLDGQRESLKESHDLPQILEFAIFSIQPFITSMDRNLKLPTLSVSPFGLRDYIKVVNTAIASFVPHDDESSCCAVGKL